MAGSKMPMPIGRLQFLQRFSLITAFFFALDSLPRVLKGSKLPYRFEDAGILSAIVIVLLAKSMIRTINGRFQDAALPRGYAPAAWIGWILGVLLLPWNRTWPIGAVLVGFLLIAGGSIPGKAVNWAATVERVEELGVVSGATIPLSLFIGPVSFLRTLFTFACIGIPLIWVAGSVSQPVGPVTADFGFGILYFVWLIKVLGRLADSGHASNWYWGPFCIGVTAVSFLPFQHHLLSWYEALGLFLFIQTPLALLPSRHEADKFNEERLRKIRERVRRKREERVRRWGRKEIKQPRLRPLAFLIALLVIGCLSALLIYVGRASGGGVGIWFTRSGLFVLIVAWMTNVNARFNDAGLIEGWYGSQFVLAVSVASLMPLAVHWVNGYGALAIFLLLQIPTVFLRSKPASEAAP